MDFMYIKNYILYILMVINSEAGSSAGWYFLGRKILFQEQTNIILSVGAFH